MTNNGKIGIALLSFAHVHARGYADQVRDHADCEIAAIWDEDTERGTAESDKRGAPFYASLDELLALPEIDGVVVKLDDLELQLGVGEGLTAGSNALVYKMIIGYEFEPRSNAEKQAIRRTPRSIARGR